MNNQRKIGLIAGVIVLMILFVWMLSGGESHNENGIKKTFVSKNWNKKYQIHDKNPLGLYLFTTLTRTHIGASNEMYEVQNALQLDTLLSDSNDVTLMFTGNKFGLTSEEVEDILEKVDKGSDWFLAYNELTENIYDELPIEFNYQFDYADEINVFSPRSKYKMINLFQNDTVACDWKAFEMSEMDSTAYISLSSFMEMDNAIRVPYGDGAILLHANPSMFYNYQLKRASGYRYTEYILSEIDPKKDVLLLEIGRLADDYGSEDIDFNEGPGEKQDDSYLQLIFRSPQLLMALLLGIFGLFLFVIFRSKRTRPVVPYIGKKKDMTLAFAETITSIYFAKRNPYGILQVQRKNFYDTMQKHFFIDLNKRESDKPVQSLSEKTNMNFDALKKLISDLETKEAFSVSEVYITDTLSRIRKLYRNVGIITDDVNDRIEEREMTFRRSLFLPVILVLGGIFIFLYGVYYLMLSIGVGIVFWPIGILMLILGILRLRKPYMIINQESFIYYTPFGRKLKYAKEDLATIEEKKSGVILNFVNNKNLIINYWDLSRFDLKQFKKLISKLNKLKL